MSIFEGGGISGPISAITTRGTTHTSQQHPRIVIHSQPWPSNPFLQALLWALAPSHPELSSYLKTGRFHLRTSLHKRTLKGDWPSGISGTHCPREWFCPTGLRPESL